MDVGAPDWIAAANERLAAVDRAATNQGAIGQTATELHLGRQVTGHPHSFTLHVTAQGATVTPGIADATVVLDCDQPTAAALADGSLSVQAAVLSGSLRLTGATSDLVDAGPVLTPVVDALGDLWAMG